jgi:transcription elongation factor GreA
VSTDGREARVRHPSGSEEPRRVDGQPPPRALPPDAHEVRRLFAVDELRRAWIEHPTPCLSTLLAEHGGSLATVGLKGVLVPRIVPEDRFEEVLGRLRADCTREDPALPAYDSRRRMFVAPGATAPLSRKPPARPRAATRPGAPKGPGRSVPSSVTPTAAAEQPRWVDLTRLPEIRALISRVEGEVTELTRELAVDLPQRLEEARAHGDLRENAEYDAAKERLAYVQARIEQLRERLGRLHELSRVRLVPGQITVMSRVTVTAEPSDEERTLRITPAELPDPSPGDVSAGTPYGRALLGKAVGDVVVVRLPSRTERLEILSVADPDDQAPGRI